MKGLALFVLTWHIVLETATWDALLSRKKQTLPKFLVRLLDFCCIRKWQSLNGFLCEKAKALPISLANVPGSYALPDRCVQDV